MFIGQRTPYTWDSHSLRTHLAKYSQGPFKKHIREIRSEKFGKQVSSLRWYGWGKNSRNKKLDTEREKDDEKRLLHC